MAFDFAELVWHQDHDTPGPEFTPIWNEYLQSGCVAKLTKEEALQQWLFFLGDLEAAVNEIADLRAEFIRGMVSNGMPREEAEKQVTQDIPYEFLFIYMM